MQYTYLFQGVKRLTCSIYFSAHPEVHQPKDNSLKMAAAAAAKIKTNPNWGDIRYDPQHHRLVREGNSSASSGGQHSAAAASRTGLWSGAKVCPIIAALPVFRVQVVGIVRLASKQLFCYFDVEPRSSAAEYLFFLRNF